MIASTISHMMRPTARLRPMRNSSLENPAMSLSDPATWAEFTQGQESDAGVPVSHDSALSIAPVWQALSIISGDVAICPLNVYRRLANDDREIDTTHPAQYLLTVQPNEETSAFELWRRAIVHAALWGNGYVYIARRGRVGPPIALLNLLPDRTETFYGADKRLAYKTRADSREVILDRSEVIHIKGLSFENGKGKDLVDAARQAWGLAIAAQTFAGRFFANGAQAGGLLEVPAAMTPKAKTNLEEGFEKKHTGRDNWFKTVILREGAKFHQTTIDAESSQLLESREEDVRSVARYFNLPGFKLDLADSVSYNSAEQAQLAYVTGCLTHWLHAVAGEVAIKLLSPIDLMSRTRFVEHNTTKLIEADTKTTNEVLEIQLRNTIINPDEWRRKINLNRRPDGKGGEYGNPNVKPASAAPAEPMEPDETDDMMENRLTGPERAVLADVVGRMARRLSMEAKRRVADPGKLVEWLAASCADQRDCIARAFAPAVALAAARTGEDQAAMADRLLTEFIARFGASLAGTATDPVMDGGSVPAVESACTAFENRIVDETLSIVETCHAHQTDD